jgi:hypothetical protein
MLDEELLPPLPDDLEYAQKEIRRLQKIMHSERCRWVKSVELVRFLKLENKRLREHIKTFHG